MKKVGIKNEVGSMYAYLDEEIVVVLLQVCWWYVETTDFVLLRELRLLHLRSFAGAPSVW